MKRFVFGFFSAFGLTLGLLTLALPTGGANAQGSCPAYSTATKVVTATTYTLSGPDDCHQLAFTGSSPNVTVPAVGSNGDLVAGYFVEIWNNSATTLTLTGTINGATNPTLAAGRATVLRNDGSAWYAPNTSANAGPQTFTTITYGSGSAIGATLAGGATGTSLTNTGTTSTIDLGNAGVNHIVVYPAATGSTPGVLAGGAGADAAEAVAFGTGGTGNISFLTDFNVQQFGVTRTATAVDYLSCTGAATANPATVPCVTLGTDTNINLSLAGKGTGVVLLGGAACTVAGATPVTCNGQTGLATSGTLTTAAATDATPYVINNSSIAATSIVSCWIAAYSGTYSTNGNPVLESCVPGSTTLTINLRNVNAANALNGTVKFGFAIIR